MDTQSITVSPLYFRKLINVIHSRIHDRFRPSYTNGRRSDAFVYILEGSCRYTFDNGWDFTVQQGDILYLASKSVYTMRIQALDYEYIYCDFEFDVQAPLLSNGYTPKSSPEAESRFRKLLHSFRQPAYTAFCQCMSELYGIYGLVLQAANADYVPRSAKQKIEAVKAYMDANLHDPALSIAALAERAGMSQVHFRKLFRSIYGTSPSRALSDARLQRAVFLMVNYPFLTLEECAMQSGFTTLQYFCRVFKASMHMTPAAYRKQATEESTK